MFFLTISEYPCMQWTTTDKPLIKMYFKKYLKVNLTLSGPGFSRVSEPGGSARDL